MSLIAVGTLFPAIPLAIVALNFRYDWTVNDGTLITFNVMDLFEFRPGTDKVSALTLIYDTQPIRQTAGNKYES